MSGWFIGILVILCQLINDQEYVSVLMLCGPLLTKGVVFLLRTFEMVNKLKNQLGQNFSASYYEIYLASRQHVLSAENLKSTGETTDLNLRSASTIHGLLQRSDGDTTSRRTKERHTNRAFTADSGLKFLKNSAISKANGE